MPEFLKKLSLSRVCLTDILCTNLGYCLVLFNKQINIQNWDSESKIWTRLAIVGQFKGGSGRDGRTRWQRSDNK